VKTDNGAGGFIRSGDRVDVRRVERAGATTPARAQTVLRNVRVLSFEQTKGSDGSANGGWVATLEVDQAAGDALVEALAVGDLLLALRSFADERAGSGLAQLSPGQPVPASAPHTVTVFSAGAVKEVQVPQ
jgi:Flp pilus assembly protein CpaB